MMPWLQECVNPQLQELYNPWLQEYVTPWFQECVIHGYKKCNQGVTRVCNPMVTRLCNPMVIRVCNPMVTRVCNSMGTQVCNPCLEKHLTQGYKNVYPQDCKMSLNLHPGTNGPRMDSHKALFWLIITNYAFHQTHYFYFSSDSFSL